MKVEGTCLTFFPLHFGQDTFFCSYSRILWTILKVWPQFLAWHLYSYVGMFDTPPLLFSFIIDKISSNLQEEFEKIKKVPWKDILQYGMIRGK